METIANFTRDECAVGSGQRVQAISNPATGEQIRQVAMSTTQETEQAIAAAHDTFPGWARYSPLKHTRVVFRFRALLGENTERLTHIISEKHGKVLSDVVDKLTRSLEVVELTCDIPHPQKGEHSTNIGTGADSRPLIQPLGVCVGITPFNFLAMIPVWMFPIALATGNTSVLKPSEKDPSLTLVLARLLQEVGLPGGVFNIMQGDKESVDMLLIDPRAQAVSFVGSTPIAEYIYQTASTHGECYQTSGDAENRCILMPDIDMNMVTNAIMGAAYGAAGGRCVALSVVPAVRDETTDELCSRLEKQIAALCVGLGLDQTPENEMGPLVLSVHRNKMPSYIDSGESQGANLRVGGRRFSVEGHEQGRFVGPTLLDDATPEMTIYKEEIFGPVLSVVHVIDYSSTVGLINRHEYGNGAAILTHGGGCTCRFCEEVQAGMVGVDVPVPISMVFHSFGGWKWPIFGTLSVHGNDGVRFCTWVRIVTARQPKTSWDAGTALSMPTLG